MFKGGVKLAYSLNFKLKVIKHVNLCITPVEQIAEIRGIPKQTIYRWIYLYGRYSEKGLQNKKPGAEEIRISINFEIFILSLWAQRNAGVHKIWLSLQEKGFTVSERQLQKIYRRYGLKMNKRNRPSQIKFVKYEWPKPNALWHTDWTECPFTGKYIIAFIDNYSRFIVHAERFDNATTENTLLAFAKAIKKYNKPEHILTDNGPQFHENGPFEEFCKAHEIKHILGRIHHPQTNGKIERWFGTLKQEFRQGQDTLDIFVKYYNEERLHQGIGYKIPSERYKSNINAV